MHLPLRDLVLQLGDILVDQVRAGDTAHLTEGLGWWLVDGGGTATLLAGAFTSLFASCALLVGVDADFELSLVVVHVLVDRPGDVKGI